MTKRSRRNRSPAFKAAMEKPARIKHATKARDGPQRSSRSTFEVKARAVRGWLS
jgi:hypothetical protein